MCGLRLNSYNSLLVMCLWDAGCCKVLASRHLVVSCYVDGGCEGLHYDMGCIMPCKCTV